MRLHGLIVGLAAACATSAAAQDDGLIIDQDRADRRAPGVELETHVEPALQAAPAPRVDAAPFVLRSVRVEGSTLSPAALDRATQPLLGETFDGDRLGRIADTIAVLYAHSDVALYRVEIPDQDFASGDVHVRVREGYIATINLSGDTGGNIGVVRDYAAALSAERPLSRATMERQLSLLSDIPGLETSVGMSAADASGGVRMNLGLTRTPWEYELGLNNSGSEALGETRLSATLIRNALFRVGDETLLTAAADAEFEHFSYFALSHRQPIGPVGASIAARISTLSTEPENGLRGHADAAGLSFSHPWLRSYRRNLTLGLALDGLNSDNAQLGGVSSSERARAVRGSAAFVDTRARRGWVVGATLSQGLDDLGARAADPTTSLDFSKFNLQISHNRAVGHVFFLRAAVSAQATGDNLPASERFTLGGAAFGRGFPGAFISGDSGYGASAELAWRVRRGWLSETYAFADGGSVRLHQYRLDREISSAGLGVRLAINDETRLDLELAQPIEQPDPEDQDLRVRFALRARL